MKKLNLIKYGLLCSIILPLTAKATPFKPVTTPLPNTNVVANPIYKIGTPYTVGGIKYHPGSKGSYDIIGSASWYGSKFNGKLTSNGEIFNKDLVTAASNSLALPSIVEVTNLDNGKKLLVRVNDRGPYKKNRVIDLSERAAELLGFKDKGVARVRVRLIPDLSKFVAEQTPNYVSTLTAKPVSTGAHVLKASSSQSIANADSNNTLCDTKNKVEPLASSANYDAASNVPNQAQASNDYKNMAIDSSKLKQVNLAEPKGIKQYVPRGVFVQIGAFGTNNKKIRSNISSLSKVGVITLQNIDLDGKNFLRVRVGPYGSISDASKVKKVLAKLGYKNPRIVVEN